MKMVALSILMSIMFCHAGTMEFQIDDDGFPYPMASSNSEFINQHMKIETFSDFNSIVCNYDTQSKMFMIEMMCEPDSIEWFGLKILNSKNVWFDMFID